MNQYHKDQSLNINAPSITQITDLLQKYEDKLTSKRDASQVSYEKFTQDLITIESDLEKKHKEKFSRMKSSANDFIQHQKEALEMISEVTRGVYNILEKMAVKEIEKDPMQFIRRESMFLPAKNGASQGSRQMEDLVKKIKLQK